VTDDEILSRGNINRAIMEIDDEAHLLRLLSIAVERKSFSTAFRVHHRYSRVRSVRERYELLEKLERR
jgi:hypothetical protein